MSLQPVDFLICAAGAGARLSGHFHGRPKPLIRWRGRTLLEISLDSLDVLDGDRLIFIVQKAHAVKSTLEKTLADRFRGIEIHWVELDGLTSGQLETALAARKLSKPGHGVAIFNSDTFSRSIDLSREMRDQPPAGIILCQKQPDRSKTHFSFCKTESTTSRKIIETAEKVAISEWASVGLYFFKNWDTFTRFGDLEMKKTDSKEKYVIPAYNTMIKEGLEVRLVESQIFKPMGTPEDFESYWQTKLADIALENSAGTVLVDLDGTVTIDEPGIDYAKKKPNLTVIKRLRELKAEGYAIVFHTARRMRTFKGDEAKVIEDVGLKTLEWLKRHDVPCDGLRFGKPYCENGFIVDDMAVRPLELLATPTAELKKRLQSERERLEVGDNL